jgi:hypothetical protein
MAENIDVRTSLALTKKAVSVADAASLASQQGVPLSSDKGNSHLIVLFPTACCSHHGTRVVNKLRPGRALYDTTEHFITTAGCRLNVPPEVDKRGWVEALTYRLPVGTLRLTYGQIIGLAGDFYGDPDNPVCTAENSMAQFQKNFDQLKNSPDQIREILEIANEYEFEPIKTAVRQNNPPSGVYANMPPVKIPIIIWILGTKFEVELPISAEDSKFMALTLLDYLPFSRYVHLAATNLDHFGQDAMTCYNAGHQLAQQLAVDAKGSRDGLMAAYAINAFADHFLTDLFAAGHMRTPRGKLYEYPLLAEVTGLCAKAMHDEDNKFGLWVENDNGDKWVAYGDARYRDQWNAANRMIMKGALQQSMNDVWEAFQNKRTSDSTRVSGYLPKLIREISDPATAQRCRDDPNNWAPLFWWNPDDKYIYKRKENKDIHDRNYAWVTSFGLAKAVVSGLGGSYMPEEQYSNAGYHKYPPVESGPTGELGWPPEPRGVTGDKRVMHGATGPDLRDLQATDWRIDGATGPTAPG